jgi:hypothetical protein
MRRGGCTLGTLRRAGRRILLQRSKLYSTAFLAFVSLWSFSGIACADCLASFREIKFPDGSARVKNYVCKSEGAGKPDLRVEFDRLSEAAAGSLIQGTPYPELDKVFGKVRLIDNAVSKEAKTLFEKFGTKSMDENCFAFQVASASGGKGYHNNADATCGQRTLWYLTFPDRENLTTFPMPLPDAMQHYTSANDWPQGFSFFYDAHADCAKSPIPCTTLWRPARAKDLANYDENQATLNKMLGFDNDTTEPTETGEAEEDASQSAASDSEAAEPDETEPDDWAKVRKRYFDLITYLTRDGMPDDFLFVTGHSTECGGGIDFSLHIRQMLFDVAFIQNLSNRPLSVEGLLGSEVPAGGLHPAGSSPNVAPGQIAVASGEIKPGETIAVPLVISFIMADSLKEPFKDQVGAAKIFKAIQSAKPGTVFELKDEDATPPVVIRKTRESFGPPTVPKPALYAFGPELQLTGLVIGGNQLVFDQASRNFMQLTAGEGYGSCPYLYAWDDADHVWVRYGKIIDKANSKDKEMTETKTFSGFRARFRLAEEELEISYIDHVKLEVDLKDGTGMTLKPNFQTMAEQDAHYATIKMGDKIEFSFALPPTVKTDDVKRSTLAITGYYRRYSDLLMAKQ